MVEFVPATSSGRGDPVGEEADNGIVIERREKFSAVCKWQIKEFSKMKQRTTRCLYSRYFEVGGFDCRLLVYPAGDAQALPGYISIYLQVTDPKNASGRWDCFASYRLCVSNQADSSKDIARDSWHRFSAKRKSHGWCDFAQSSVVLDPSTGFAISDTILVTADILVLSEQTQSVRENEVVSASSNATAEVLSGKFTWKVCNFGLFRDMIKTQKIMSPAFNAGECNLRLSVYQSAVSGTDFLSMCLESKDTDKSSNIERSCWCLFRMSVLSQVQGGRHMHRDSYGRFAADSKTGDNTSLGWNDFMSVAAFTDPEAGYLCNNIATFSASFHIIKESSNFNRSIERGLIQRGRGNRAKGGPNDTYQGKFTWKIEHFTRLKELLKKRKITGLCIKSRRFQVGSRDCRLIVYPRGQSQPPNHLSMFLEVTDSSANHGDWSCFVSHRLSVVNQRSEDKSVAKESQNRYSKQAKDWGWREFVTLTSLFDLDAGFLVNDCVMFAAEVLVLRETSELKALAAPKKQPQQYLEYHPTLALPQENEIKMRFSWRIENFVAFKEIMETRKIFSRYFSVEGCDLRIGVYESFDTLCIYLESDAFGSGLERNFWVKYRIAILNQKYPERTEWKEASICTKTWNNSVLQFMKVTEMVDQEAGYIQRDGLLLACEVVDCQPWFDFADLEVFASDSEAESLSTDPEEVLDSDDSDALTPEEEDTFRSLLGDAGLHVVGAEAGTGLDMHDLQQVLSDKMHLDADAAASFVAGLHLYMDDDPYKIKRLLQPGQPSLDGREPGICLFDLLMGIEVLQAPLLDLLLDVLLQLCHQQPKARPAATRTRRQAPFSSSMDTAASLANAYSRFNLESREDGECASSSAALPSMELHSSKILSGNDSSSSGTATPQEGQISAEASPELRPSQQLSSSIKLPAHDANCNGSHLAWLSGREKAEELIMIAFRWLATVDQFMCLRTRPSKGRPGPFTLQRVQNLLAELPRQLQPQLVLLVPKLVSPLEHTTAAGILLARLAEASREGPEAEQELRLPVLSALGLLSIEPAAAVKVLHSALEALPALTDSELAPAVGLILKLASESQGLRTQAVQTVRRKVRSCPEVSIGTLDAIRLAVNQHEDIATAMLADIDAGCRAAKPATSMEGSSRDPHGNTAEQIHSVDLEVLLDLLRNPGLVEKTRAIIERALSRGLLNEVMMAMTLEQRRIRCLANDQMQHHFFPDGSHIPQEYVTEQQMGLHQPLHNTDDSDAVLALAESLASSKSSKLKMFSAALYQTVFRVTSEETRRGRMLRALIARAAVGTACHQAQTNKEKAANSSAAAQSRSAVGNNPANHASRSPRSEPGQPPEGRPDMDVTTPEGLLLALVSQYPGAAKPALIIMMLEAQTANAKASLASRKLHELEHGQDKSLKEAKVTASRYQNEAEQLTQRLTNAETEMAELRRDHTSEAAGFATSKRELEERVRNLERELEWVRGEREEERTALAHERRETAGRMRELEAASNRLKSARKDDLKRVTREKAQALERCKELEASNHRLEEEVRHLSDRATTSLATQESLVSKCEEQERSSKATLRQRDDEVTELNKRIQGLQAACNDHQHQATIAETQLREELARSAPLHGHHLDRLTASQLEGLARLHERGLKHARALQGQKRSEESAAATAYAAANAVTGGPPPRQLRFPKGMPLPNAQHPQRSNSSLGSTDSMMSLGLDPPISAALRALPPADRAPGSAQLASARSADRPNGVFVNDAPQNLHRAMTPGIASYYNQNAGLSNGVFHQANATLPNGFPNGLLSGTGLLNGQQQKGNGTHKLW